MIVNYKIFCKLGLLAVLTIVLLSCGEKDKDVISKSDYEGNWKINSSTSTIRINNMSFVDYYVQYMEYTQDDAEVYYILLTSDITGNFLFNEDGTYVITWDGVELQKGNWDVSPEGEQILLDKNTTFEMIIDVLSVCRTALQISFIDSGIGDLNEDGDPELIEFKYYFGLIK
jgi:hypothetical protein